MELLSLAHRIAADPRLPAAAHAIAVGVLACHAQSPELARLMADRGQYHIISICYGLHPAIAAAAVMRQLPPGLAGRNRVAAYLAALRRAEHLLPSDGLKDRRTRPMRLSPPLLDWLDRWAIAIVSPARPWVEGPLPDMTDMAVRAGWYRQFVEAHARGLMMLAAAPGVAEGMSRRGGGILLLELMRRHDSPEAVPPFSRKAFADRYGLSRTQVIDLIAAFEAAGWIVPAPGGHRPAPDFLAQVRHWQAMHLAVATCCLEERLLEALDAAGFPPGATSRGVSL